MNPNPSRELDLDFPINEIKQKIDAVIEAGKLAGYKTLEKNDLFNTYRISIVSGVLVGILNITLNKVDESKTNWKSEIMNAAGGKAEPAVLARFQDEFLGILSKALNGEEVNSELIKTNKSGGCLGIIAVLITISLALAHLS